MWTGNVRGAHEGSIKDARQHCYWHSFVSFTIKALPPLLPLLLLLLSLLRRNALKWHCSWLHVEARSSVSIFLSRPVSLTRQLVIIFFSLVFCLLVCELNMTFRRLKKVNSSGPESGPTSQDNDIYFPSSKSDSCRTVDLPTNSSEVYSYRTLAYSGGTLPRNFKKVVCPHSLSLLIWSYLYFLSNLGCISY